MCVYNWTGLKCPPDHHLAEHRKNRAGIPSRGSSHVLTSSGVSVSSASSGVASTKSAGEVKTISATRSSTISRMKHAEIPPITRKKGLSLRRRRVEREEVGWDGSISLIGTGVGIDLPTESFRGEDVLRIG